MSGCGYTGYHFGASYPDAECHEGTLWDLDSFEDGLLTSGGTEPCPACNTQAALAHYLEEIVNDGDADCNQIGQWEHVVIALHHIAPKSLPAAMAGLDLPVFQRFQNCKVIESRHWPWRVKELTAHENAALGCSPKGH